MENIKWEGIGVILTERDDLVYMASAIDWEGNIHLNRQQRYFHPFIRVSNTYYDGLVEIREKFGGAIYKKKKGKDHHRQAWEWQLYVTEDIRQFLLKILPHLREKKPQALVMLEALDLPGTEREWHFEELKRLKHIESTGE